MSNRFLPSLKQIRDAAAQLPDPEKWPDEVYLVPVKGPNKTNNLEFRRVRLSESGNRKERWVFEGKIIIRHRDIAAAIDDVEDTASTANSGSGRATLAKPKAKSARSDAARPRSTATSTASDGSSSAAASASSAKSASRSRRSSKSRRTAPKPDGQA